MALEPDIPGLLLVVLRTRVAKYTQASVHITKMIIRTTSCCGLHSSYDISALISALSEWTVSRRTPSVALSVELILVDERLFWELELDGE